VRDATGAVDAIAFGLGERNTAPRPGSIADVAFVPTRNDWRGERRVQLRVRDLRTR
jgi:hypothetical protein